MTKAKGKKHNNKLRKSGFSKDLCDKTTKKKIHLEGQVGLRLIK